MPKRFASVENGMVTNIFLAANWPGAIDVTELEPQPSVGWGYADGIFTAPVPPPAPAPIRHITRLAFWQRFTQTERIDIDLTSEAPKFQDEGFETETRVQFNTRRRQASALRDLRTQVNSATFIDLDRPDTRAGVQQLETLGLLAAGRALTILDGVIDDSERPL